MLPVDPKRSAEILYADDIVAKEIAKLFRKKPIDVYMYYYAYSRLRTSTIVAYRLQRGRSSKF